MIGFAALIAWLARPTVLPNAPYTYSATQKSAPIIPELRGRQIASATKKQRLPLPWRKTRPRPFAIRLRKRASRTSART
jgi:hypothetical protein